MKGSRDQVSGVRHSIPLSLCLSVPHSLITCTWHRLERGPSNSQKKTPCHWPRASRPSSTGIGWQHWFSPQIEMRPEVTYYKALDAFAFNGNSNLGIPANRKYAIVGAADIIIHF